MKTNNKKKIHKKDINSQIKELESRLASLKKRQKAEEANRVRMSMVYAKNLKENPTEAEKQFLSIVKRKKLHLEFQIPIYIREKNRIIKFYIVDFCDNRNHIIVEIDGEYHLSEERQKLDRARTRDLKKMGYSVYRIPNIAVYEGKSTEFLYYIYKELGIDILK